MSGFEYKGIKYKLERLNKQRDAIDMSSPSFETISKYNIMSCKIELAERKLRNIRAGLNPHGNELGHGGKL